MKYFIFVFELNMEGHLTLIQENNYSKSIFCFSTFKPIKQRLTIETNLVMKKPCILYILEFI